MSIVNEPMRTRSAAAASRTPMPSVAARLAAVRDPRNAPRCGCFTCAPLWLNGQVLDLVEDLVVQHGGAAPDLQLATLRDGFDGIAAPDRDRTLANHREVCPDRGARIVRLGHHGREQVRG